MVFLRGLDSGFLRLTATTATAVHPNLGQTKGQNRHPVGSDGNKQILKALLPGGLERMGWAPGRFSTGRSPASTRWSTGCGVLGVETRVV
jgi:hypothetical protein